MAFGAPKYTIFIDKLAREKTVEELEEMLKGNAPLADMAEYDLTPEEWRHGVEEVIKEKKG